MNIRPPRPLPLCAVAGLLTAVLTLPAPAQTADNSFTFRGPIPTRDAEPLNTPFLLPVPSAATILPRGHSRLDFTVDMPNNLENISSPARSYVTDFEEQRLTLGYAYGIDRRQEATVRLPLIARNKGILDRIIKSYDRLLGLSGNGRDQIPANRNIFNVTDVNGNSVINGSESTVGLGDVVLEYRYALTPALNENPAPKFSVVARALAKLPTGSTSHLFSSGGTDVGAGLAASWKVARRLAIHGNLTGVKQGDAKNPVLNARSTVVHSMLAGEYALGHRANFVIQMDSNQAPVTLGFDPADVTRKSLTMGIWRQLNDRKQFFASFTENKLGPFGKDNKSNAPDFTLSLGLRVVR